MSRLWSEQVRIGIGINRMDFVRLHPGGRSRVIATRSIEYPGGADQDASQTLAAVFAQGLAELEVRRANTVCSIVLGSQWVRYQLVPWQDGLTDMKEFAAYAVLQLQTVYGSLAANWRVACSDARYGSAMLVSAIDRDLIEALQRTAASGAVRLVSVKPYLSAALLHWRRDFSARDFWFALIEGGRICLLNAQGGKPQLLCVQQVRGPLHSELASMLRREAIASGRAGKDWPVYVVCPDAPKESLGDLRGLDAHTLDAARYLGPVKSDLRYAMAMI